MGKKYIIELPENTHWIQWLMEGTEDHHPYMDFKSVEDLTSYTEPDLEQVRKEAYEKGYKKCMSENDFDSPCISCDKYEQGLNDAWEAARKIACDEGIDMNTLCTIFGRGSSVSIIRDYSASEAIEKIRQYEQEQKEQIQVGDEVIATSGKAVIVSINDDKDKARYIYHDSTLGFDKVCNLSKTGRHFPEIAAVLEKMRGEHK